MRSTALAVLAVLAACGSDGNNGAPGAAGATGATGPAGAAGEGPAPTVALVSPSVALLDRELDVQVAVDAITVDASSTVDFGAGVVVSNLQALSPTVLGAHLKIDPAAPVGAREVKVTTGGRELSSPTAFEVRPAIDVKLLGGTFVGGGLVRLQIDLRDPSDLFEGGPLLDNGLLSLGAESASATSTVLTALVDPTASGAISPRAWNLSLATNAMASTFRGATIPVAAAAAIPIAPTIAASVTRTGESFAAPYATHIYKVSTNEAGILRLRHANIGAQTQVAGVLMGSSGKAEDSFAGIVPSPDVVVPLAAGATDHYWTVYNGLGTGGSTAEYRYDLVASVLSAPFNAEGASAHGTLATAQPLTVTGNMAVVEGQLAAGEVDVYKLTTTVADSIAFYTEGNLALVVSSPGGSQTASYAVTWPGRYTAASGALTPQANFYLTVRAQAFMFGAPNPRPTGKYRFAVVPSS